MANKYWQGGAAPVAQVLTFLFGGTWEATDVIRVQIGNRVYDFVAGSTSVNTVVSNIVTAWNNLNSSLYPEFREITASANTATLTLTAVTPGNPFAVTITPLETNLASADAQTIEGVGVADPGTIATANSSPTDPTVAANWSGGTLPADGDTIIFKNSAVDCDAADYSSMNLNVVVEMSYTGKIGRPVTNVNGYPEYRRTYFRFGTDDSPVQSVTIGQGQGAGSGRIKLDFGGSRTDVVVYNTGAPIEAGVPALLIKGTDANNTLAVNKGSVGVAVLPYDVAAGAEETATLTTLAVGYVTNPNGDASVRLGSGVTVATIDQSGGLLEINSGATTITKTGGELTLAGGVTGSAVTVTTLNERGGSTIVTGVTTITTANVANTGSLDYSRDMRAKTLTNPVNIYGDKAKFLDPFKVTGSVVIDCEQGGVLANLNLGQHIKLTRGAPT